MTLRIWRARIESVVVGKDDARQVTAMFSTEPEALALVADLTTFARNQSVRVALGSPGDQARIAALNAGERALAPATKGAGAATPARGGGHRLDGRHADLARDRAGRPAPLQRLRYRGGARRALLLELRGGVDAGMKGSKLRSLPRVAVEAIG